MNYYIQGNKEKAEEIKAAFERMGYSTSLHAFFDEDTVFITLNGNIYECNYGGVINELIKTHPDYKELELPVEPKFKVGDWIVRGSGFIYEPSLITEIRDYYICELQNGEKVTFTLNDVHKNFHLWSIADAKDGDIIGFNDCTHNDGSCIDWVGIYKQEIETNQHLFHCVMPSCRSFRVGGMWRVFTAYPATKEQRDMLFAKMKEAGYEWDADKKELHKIINPKFKVGDEIIWNEPKGRKPTEPVKIIRLINEDQLYMVDMGNGIGHISYDMQDYYKLVPKKHYDISNFHAGMPVLVRDINSCKWCYLLYSHYDNTYEDGFCFNAGSVDWRQCIPFNDDTKHLLGTTDMPSEEYINW